LPVETASSEETALLVEKDLAPAEGTLCDLLGVDESHDVDDLVELSGLTSSEVMAAQFDLELKGVVRQLPGKQFLKVLL
jgi:DNA processing protein